MFFVYWILASYAMYVFVAERFSPFPPKKFSPDRHGIRASRRYLGYQLFLFMAIAGLLVELLLSGYAFKTKAIFAFCSASIFCLPVLSIYYKKRHAA